MTTEFARGEIAIAIVTSMTLYAFADWFMRGVLCAETRDLISPRVGFTFASTFAVTSSMLMLMLYEVAGAMSAKFLRAHWALNLRLATLALLVVAPWQMFLGAFESALARRRAASGEANDSRRARRSKAEAAAFATACTAIFVVTFISTQASGSAHAHVARDGTEVAGKWTMIRVVSRTAVLGISLLGVLSGFGAVHFPYTTMRIFNRAIPDAEVFSLERRLVQSVETIVERKKRVLTLKNDMAREESGASASSASASTSLFGRLKSGLRLPGLARGRANQLVELSAEIDALETVNKTLFYELHDVNLQRERAKIAKTPYGRYLEVCGVAMFIVCSYRFIFGLKRLIFHQAPTTDPITTALHLFLADKSIVIDPEVLAQYLSLLLIAFLVGNSMQNFVHQLTKLFFAVGGGVTTNALVLFTTEMVGLYFLSSVLLVREQLPESYRQVVTEALGADLEFRFYAKFYELIFMASAALTALLLYVRHITAVKSEDLVSYASTRAASTPSLPTKRSSVKLS